MPHAAHQVSAGVGGVLGNGAHQQGAVNVASQAAAPGKLLPSLCLPQNVPQAQPGGIQPGAHHCAIQVLCAQLAVAAAAAAPLPQPLQPQRHLVRVDGVAIAPQAQRVHQALTAAPPGACHAPTAQAGARGHWPQAGSPQGAGLWAALPHALAPDSVPGSSACCASCPSSCCGSSEGQAPTGSHGSKQRVPGHAAHSRRGLGEGVLDGVPAAQHCHAAPPACHAQLLHSNAIPHHQPSKGAHAGHQAASADGPVPPQHAVLHH